MAKRMVKGTVVVKREDPANEGKFKRVVPKIGEAFDFTADEIKGFNAVSPGALVKLDAEDTEVETSAHPAETVKAAAPAADAKKAAPKKAAPKTDDDDL